MSGKGNQARQERATRIEKNWWLTLIGGLVISVETASLWTDSESEVLKLQKIFLAQLVALKFIYNMEFRAKFYLK